MRDDWPELDARAQRDPRRETGERRAEPRSREPAESLANKGPGGAEALDGRYGTAGGRRVAGTPEVELGDELDFESAAAAQAAAREGLAADSSQAEAVREAGAPTASAIAAETAAARRASFNGTLDADSATIRQHWRTDISDLIQGVWESGPAEARRLEGANARREPFASGAALSPTGAAARQAGPETAIVAGREDANDSSFAASAASGGGAPSPASSAGVPYDYGTPALQRKLGFGARPGATARVADMAGAAEARSAAGAADAARAADAAGTHAGAKPAASRPAPSAAAREATARTDDRTGSQARRETREPRRPDKRRPHG